MEQHPSLFIVATAITASLLLVLLAGCISPPTTPPILSDDTVWLTTPLHQCEEPRWISWHNGLGRTYIRAPTSEEILIEFMETQAHIEVLEVRRNESGQMACQACGCQSGISYSVRVHEKDAKTLESMSSQQWIRESEETSNLIPFEKPTGKFCDKETGTCTI